METKKCSCVTGTVLLNEICGNCLSSFEAMAVNSGTLCNCDRLAYVELKFAGQSYLFCRQCLPPNEIGLFIRKLIPANLENAPSLKLISENLGIIDPDDASSHLALLQRLLQAYQPTYY